jgi:hypothetical protein
MLAPKAGDKHLFMEVASQSIQPDLATPAPIRDRLKHIIGTLVRLSQRLELMARDLLVDFLQLLVHFPPSINGCLIPFKQRRPASAGLHGLKKEIKTCCGFDEACQEFVREE